MKSLGTLAAAIAILTVPACNDAGNADQAASADASPSADGAESADAVQPCEWLTTSMVKAEFPDAQDITQESDDGPNPMCNYEFTAADRDYVLNFTVAPGIGEQDVLDSIVSRFDDTSPVPDLGEGAYYVGSPARQVSVWTGEHIFHLALRHGLAGDRDSAIALARRVLEQRS